MTKKKKIGAMTESQQKVFDTLIRLSSERPSSEFSSSFFSNNVSNTNNDSLKVPDEDEKEKKSTQSCCSLM